jgi:hypothetical protein
VRLPWVYYLVRGFGVLYVGAGKTLRLMVILERTASRRCGSPTRGYGIIPRKPTTVALDPILCFLPFAQGSYWEDFRNVFQSEFHCLTFGERCNHAARAKAPRHTSTNARERQKALILLIVWDPCVGCKLISATMYAAVYKPATSHLRHIHALDTSLAESACELVRRVICAE